MAEAVPADDEGEEAALAPKPKSALVGKLINAAGIFVLCLGAVVTGGFVNNMLFNHPVDYKLDKDGVMKPVIPLPPPKPKVVAAPPVEKPAAKPPAPAVYLKMDPQMVVNFDASSEVKFLALDIEFMARDQAVLDDVTRNMPKIRNNILMLISNRDYKTLMTREGKDKLRLEALEEAKKVLKQETGSAKLEDVFFTSFVVQ
jgi:flagellar basal body-associated protein FliL